MSTQQLQSVVTAAAAACLRPTTTFYLVHYHYAYYLTIQFFHIRDGPILKFSKLFIAF